QIQTKWISKELPRQPGRDLEALPLTDDPVAGDHRTVDVGDYGEREEIPHVQSRCALEFLQEPTGMTRQSKVDIPCRSRAGQAELESNAPFDDSPRSQLLEEADQEPVERQKLSKTHDRTVRGQCHLPETCFKGHPKCVR